MLHSHVITYNKRVSLDGSEADDDTGGFSPNVGSGLVVSHDLLLSPLGSMDMGPALSCFSLPSGCSPPAVTRRCARSGATLGIQPPRLSLIGLSLRKGP